MATKQAASTKKKAPTKVSKTTAKSVPASAKKSESLGDHLNTAVPSLRLWRALAAEFIGPVLLASVVIVGSGPPIFVLFGLVGIVLLVGAISGAHVNPAITVGAWVTRRIGWLRALGYILVQVLGATAAYFLLTAFIGGAASPSEEQQLYGQTAPTLFSAIDLATVTGKEWYAFFAEVLGVAILGFAVANASRNKDRLTAAFTVGLGIFLALMVAVTVANYVGASAILNPAVAVALQAFDVSAWPFAVYALGPVIGGVLGFVLYDLIRGKES